MQITSKESLNVLLSKLGEELDIPDHIYEDAVLKYESVGAWLDAEGSALREYKPEIFPQGSMRLGTTVRPIDDEGEYDIDLVCHLLIEKESITQKDLKDKVGKRLKEHDEFKKMLEESRRCWRLNYPKQFHMDILPAIPNEEQPPTGILLTDTELRLWQMSNPKAYADWFYLRMQAMIEREREVVFKADASYKSMEEVPEWRVRTPLQRAVQILKRHRDIYFANDYENCPVSIILTTLAAKAYNNQSNIYDAIVDMVRDMPLHIESRSGRWWVENPVEPGENFADKWNEKPERRAAFLRWLAQVRIDFEKALGSYSLKEASSSLGPVLGSRDVSIAAKELGLATFAQPLSTKRAAPSVPPIGSTRHVLALREREHKLYNARVSGGVHFSRGGKQHWPLSERPVPKHAWIRFAVSTNTPRPYEVKWQVVNTGTEAEAAGQPRGDFYESERSNNLVRWESTAFSGTHWVEAFIIKDGVCVARSDKKLVKVRSYPETMYLERGV